MGVVKRNTICSTGKRLRQLLFTSSPVKNQVLPPHPAPLLQYAGGLWLLSRRPDDPEATAAMEEAARKLGLDTTELLAVTHDGCTYPQP